MKRIVLRVLIITVTLALCLTIYRLIFCPKLVIANGIEISPETVQVLAKDFDGRVLNNFKLAAEIQHKKVVLVGETHFEPQVMEYFTDLLDKVADRKIVLNLEIPAAMQDQIDAYMRTGAEEHYNAIKNCSDCLPYYDIIKWCRNHREKVEKVYAADENQSKIFLKRCVCLDTRNKTMAENILKSARENPDKLIVFYGGQLHCLLDGRYLYNDENRTPAGKLLLGNTYNRSELCTILLDYDDHFPASAAWKGDAGAIQVKDDLARLPVNFFVQDTIFGATRAGALFDYYVNVGKLSNR